MQMLQIKEMVLTCIQQLEEERESIYMSLDSSHTSICEHLVFIIVHG